MCHFLVYVCILGGAQVQPMKFGVDLIKCVGVISFFVLHGEQWQVVEL